MKPTKKQIEGGFLGTVLASIGIPMVLDAVKKLTGGSSSQYGQWDGGSAPRYGRRKGGRAPRYGMYNPPPHFYGQWGKNTVGMGKKKKKKGKGLLLGKNSPFKDIPLIGAIL